MWLNEAKINKSVKSHDFIGRISHKNVSFWDTMRREKKRSILNIKYKSKVAPDQWCLIELSAMREMLYICCVWYNSHEPLVATKNLKL